MSSQGLFLQALINTFVKNYSEAQRNDAAPESASEEPSSPRASATAIRLFAAPAVNAKEVIARHTRRKVQLMKKADGSKQPEVAGVLDSQAARLRKLNKELASYSKSQLAKVEDPKVAKKLVRMFGLPQDAFQEWSEGRKRRGVKSPSPRQSRKRKSPEQDAAPRQLGRSRFAAEHAGSSPSNGNAPVAPVAGPQLMPKRLFVGEQSSSQPAAAAAGAAEAAGTDAWEQSCCMDIDVDAPVTTPAQSRQSALQGAAVAAAAPPVGSGVPGGPRRLPSMLGGSAGAGAAKQGGRKPRKPSAPKPSAPPGGDLPPWKAFMAYMQPPPVAAPGAQAGGAAAGGQEQAMVLGKPRAGAPCSAPLSQPSLTPRSTAGDLPAAHSRAAAPCSSHVSPGRSTASAAASASATTAWLAGACGAGALQAAESAGDDQSLEALLAALEQAAVPSSLYLDSCPDLLELLGLFPEISSRAGVEIGQLLGPALPGSSAVAPALLPACLRSDGWQEQPSAVDAAMELLHRPRDGREGCSHSLAGSMPSPLPIWPLLSVVGSASAPPAPLSPAAGDVATADAAQVTVRREAGIASCGSLSSSGQPLPARRRWQDLACPPSPPAAAAVAAAAAGVATGEAAPAQAGPFCRPQPQLERGSGSGSSPGSSAGPARSPRRAGGSINPMGQCYDSAPYAAPHGGGEEEEEEEEEEGCVVSLEVGSKMARLAGAALQLHSRRESPFGATRPAHVGMSLEWRGAVLSRPIQLSFSPVSGRVH